MVAKTVKWRYHKGLFVLKKVRSEKKLAQDRYHHQHRGYTLSRLERGVSRPMLPKMTFWSVIGRTCTSVEEDLFWRRAGDEIDFETMKARLLDLTICWSLLISKVCGGCAGGWQCEGPWRQPRATGDTMSSTLQRIYWLFHSHARPNDARNSAAGIDFRCALPWSQAFVFREGTPSDPVCLYLMVVTVFT